MSEQPISGDQLGQVQVPVTAADPTDAPQINAEPTNEGTPSLSKEQRQLLLTEAYTEATRQLREAHLSEFNQLRVVASQKRGVTWTPQGTKQERAKAKALAELAKVGLTAADL